MIDNKNIYVLMGGFIHNSKVGSIYTNEPSKAKFIWYVNIENEKDGILIFRNKYKEFERNNIVIKNHNIVDKEDAKHFYDEVKKIYFENITKKEDIIKAEIETIRKKI